jgi:hypothetical protein
MDGKFNFMNNLINTPPALPTVRRGEEPFFSHET